MSDDRRQAQTMEAPGSTASSTGFSRRLHGHRPCAAAGKDRCMLASRRSVVDPVAAAPRPGAAVRQRRVAHSAGAV